MDKEVSTVTQFEKIIQSPETLGAFLAALPVIGGPWDEEFQARFCTGCAAADCDACPHAAERNNPRWWLTLMIGPSEETKRTAKKIAAIVDQYSVVCEQLQQNSQPDGTRLTAEEIAEIAKGPDLQEVMAHFGYETTGEWHSTWVNKPGQIERLANLPEFIKILGLDKRFHITFDYDPTYTRMLLQATVTGPS